MRKFTFLLLALLTLVGCGDEIAFNNPAMEGSKDGDLWRAVTYSADIDFGGWLIEGRNVSGTLQLVTATDTRGTFELGGVTENVAIFRDSNGIVYSTANNPDPSVSLYPANGQIIIHDIFNTSPKTIIGSFWFNAYTADGLNSINFNEGVVYHVPLLGGLVQIDNGNNCAEATQQTNASEIAFNASNASDTDYSEICSSYREALQNKINTCGDANGNLQGIIDSLGDCVGIVTNPSGSIDVTVDGSPKTFDENILVSISDGIITVYAEEAITEDWITFKIEQNLTGIDILQGFIFHIDTNYFPFSDASGTFTSTITTNSNSIIQGSFSGPVNNPDNQSYNLTLGTIDLTY